MKYKILYLQTGEYIKTARYSLSDINIQVQYITCFFDTKDQVIRFTNSLIRNTPPKFYGIMGYNNIIFPSITKHFEIVEVGNEKENLVV